MDGNIGEDLGAERHVDTNATVDDRGRVLKMNGAEDGERPFGERIAGSFEALGTGLALLNGRLDAAEAIARATADANVEAFRDLAERVDAQVRRIIALEAALVSLARTLGVSPVWSNEGDGFPPTAH